MTNFLRNLFRGVLDKIAGSLISLGVNPNTVTLIGLMGNFLAGYIISSGRLGLGGLCVLIMGPVDAVDGALARLAGKETHFGAFFDSVADRYSELAIFFGLLIHGIRTENDLLLIWTFLAAAGSVLVSYVRARAEAVGAKSKIGILTRVERYLVIVPALILNQPLVGLIVIGLLANLTALQRIWNVRNQLMN